MTRRYNTRLVKARKSYTPEELSKLFGVCKKTCFRWIDEGLRPIEANTRPLIIMGYEVRRFLSKMKKSRKTKLEANEYFCLKCKRATRANEATETIAPTGKLIGKEAREQLCKRGKCEKCGSEVKRFL